MFSQSRGASRVPLPVGRTVGTPSIYKPYCSRDGENLTRALPLAVRRSFPALPWQPMISRPDDPPAPCTSRSCLDWNNLKRFLVITEVVQAGAAGRPLDSLARLCRSQQFP